MANQQASTPLLRDLIDSFLGIKAMTREEMSKHGLSMTHFVAMRIIESVEACTMSQLTERLDVTHGASTGVVDRLTKLGLVERAHSGRDRRVVQVELTASGRALIAEVQAGTRERFERMFSQLNPESQEHLAKGLALLAETFRNPHPSFHGETPHAASR